MMSDEELLSLFCSIGLSEQKAKETLKNAALTKRLRTILDIASKFGPIDECGMLCYQLASKLKPQVAKHLDFLVEHIATKKLDTTQRVDAALHFCLAEVKDTVDVAAFNDYCGIGVVVSSDDIELTVEEAIEKYKPELLEKRYKFNNGLILQEIRTKLKWADGKAVKNEVDLQILNLIGKKTDEDRQAISKKDKKPPTERKDAAVETVPEKASRNDVTLSILEVMKKLNFHKPGENHTTDGYVVTDHTDRLLKEHLQITGGKVRTRFPPEPNGILHIGHAKAININFGYAEAHDGVCFLRYDDTNPEKEEEKFFVGIREMVEWLGYTPYKITHSSDYFNQLYEWAITLINNGLAYVCHQRQDEIKGFNPPPSPWRDRSVHESLSLFQQMKDGLIDEGKATLRMKITLEEGKQDPVAYRIKFLPHHRTGNNWCIYPTYDYTHCLCDSLEHITHSLCTKEFQSRRSAYYWLCNALNVYCPVQWEYGRLNMNYTVVSKRKIQRLIETGVVRDWDDPRLYTLTALRRRGFPAEAIRRFCARIGVTGAQTVVEPAMLEAEVRSVLNETAPRTMAVREPLRVRIVNFEATGAKRHIEVPDFPSDPNSPTHTITFDNTIYIERSDFRAEAGADFRRLTLEQSVGLRYTGLVVSVCTESAEGLEVYAKPANKMVKPKAWIHWVAKGQNIELRSYERLFKHKNPDEVEGGFLADVRPDTLSVYNGLADRYLSESEIFLNRTFQFERIGYFTLDTDMPDDRTVFNLTVTLKEDAGKD